MDSQQSPNTSNSMERQGTDYFGTETNDAVNNDNPTFSPYEKQSTTKPTRATIAQPPTDHQSLKNYQIEHKQSAPLLQIDGVNTNKEICDNTDQIKQKEIKESNVNHESKSVELHTNSISDNEQTPSIIIKTNTSTINYNEQIIPDLSRTNTLPINENEPNYIKPNYIGTNSGSYASTPKRYSVKSTKPLSRIGSITYTRTPTKPLINDENQSPTKPTLISTPTKPLIRVQSKVKTRRNSTAIRLYQNGRTRKLTITNKQEEKTKEMFITRFETIKDFLRREDRHLSVLERFETEAYIWVINANFATKEELDKLFSKYFQLLRFNDLMYRDIYRIYGKVQNTQVGNECDRFEKFLKAFLKNIAVLKFHVECANFEDRALAVMKDLFRKHEKLRVYFVHGLPLYTGCFDFVKDLVLMSRRRLTDYLNTFIDIRNLTPRQMRNEDLFKIINQLKIANKQVEDYELTVDRLNLMEKFNTQLKGYKELSGEEFIHPSRRFIQTYHLGVIHDKKVKKHRLLIFNDILVITTKPNLRGNSKCTVVSKLENCKIVLLSDYNAPLTGSLRRVTTVVNTDNLYQQYDQILKKSRVKHRNDILRNAVVLFYMAKINNIYQQQSILIWDRKSITSQVLSIALINAIAERQNTLFFASYKRDYKKVLDELSYQF